MVRNELQTEYNSRIKWMENSEEEEELWHNHFDKWNFFDCNKELGVLLNNPGQIFLFEKFENRKISYPSVGVFINHLPCDQTLDVEWFNIRRTWEVNKEISWTDINGVEQKSDAIDFPSVLQNMPQWMDYLLIYGIWDKMPDWKTLRRHYEKTWWFRKPIDVMRENKISQLLS